MNPKTKTVTLDDIDEACTFGEKRSIEDMTPEEAIAIFGRPVYESWLARKDDPRPRGMCVVTGIGPEHGTLTLDPTTPPRPDGRKK